MPTVTEFLIERLQNLGIEYIFGGTGDYINPFLKDINNSKINFINTHDELNAGYAADAYARIKGFGCVCANYNTGALKLCNSVAGAYAERSPIVVISGSPAKKERNEDFLLHNLVKSFDNQYEIFKHLTCYSVILNDSSVAGYQIDQALEYLKVRKQPVYIEIPTDIGLQPIKYDVYRQGTPLEMPTFEENLVEAYEEVSAWIAKSKNPVILLGVQIARFNLGNQLLRFCERHNILIVSTLLGKSTISEKHSLFAGVYKGNKNTEDEILKIIYDSDCLMVFGEMPIDIGMEYQSSKFQKKDYILCSTEKLRVKSHLYCNVRFNDFCLKLFKSDLGKKAINFENKINLDTCIQDHFTSKQFYNLIQNILNEKFIVVADVEECLKGASNISVSQNQFISLNFFRNQSFALPASLGIQMANLKTRPIVILGENSFESCFFEIKTILNQNLNPIIFVLKYESRELNQAHKLCYSKINNLIEGINFYSASNKLTLENAVDSSIKSNKCSIIHVILSQE